jgi:hypothetical protein
VISDRKCLTVIEGTCVWVVVVMKYVHNVVCSHVSLFPKDSCCHLALVKAQSAQQLFLSTMALASHGLKKIGQCPKPLPARGTALSDFCLVVTARLVVTSLARPGYVGPRSDAAIDVSHND